MIVPERVKAELDRAQVAVRAPGRANLIGEHTDYNDGLVLPIAIDLATYVVGELAEDVQLRSNVESDPVRVSVEDPLVPERGWARYVAAVVTALKERGVALRGITGDVFGDVPLGAGLSSSAALEVAVAMAVLDDHLDALEIAQACRRAENRYVGVASGIMDQLTSAAARAGHACLIDCRANSIEHVPVPQGIRFLIVDSGVRRSLTDSAYNDRVDECRAAARAVGAPSLRDVTLEDLRGIDGTLAKRARHVVTENHRVMATVDAFGSGDVAVLRDVFEESHRSYSEDFEASTQEIDELVERARATSGVIAARLTGGGWGGCIIVVVGADAEMGEVRKAIGGVRSWVTEAAEGAGSLL